MIYAPLLGASLALVLCMLAYPIRILSDGCEPIRLLKNRKIKIGRSRKLGALLGFIYDFLAVVFCAVVTVVYDCGYLGGALRLHHLSLAVLGAFLARFLYTHLLGDPYEKAFRLFVALILSLLCLLTMPIRRALGAFSRFLRRMLLIYKKKHDKIKADRAAARYLKRELAGAETAFLDPSVLINAAISRRDGERYGSNSQN